MRTFPTLGRRPDSWLRQPLGKLQYIQRVKALFGSAVIGYWPLHELSGTAANDVSGNARNGTYTGVDLANAAGPKGGVAPYFDGANDYVNVTSAGCLAAINGNLGSMMVWGRAGSGVWTDATTRRLLRIAIDASNYFLLTRKTVNNQLAVSRVVGGVALERLVDSGGPAGWFHLGETWSAAADQTIAYYNGAQSGAAMTCGAMVGAATTLLFGALTTTPTQVWCGWLAHALVLDRVATADEMAQVYSWT